MPYKKKLIEVTLPLEAINEGSQQEKNPFLKGHPRALHLWWARRPLAAARAVIFSQMVDDPGSWPGVFVGEDAQREERDKLFGIIKDLVLWENTTNEAVLNQAREEIWISWRRTCDENAGHPRASELFNRDVLPAFHDPFAGGGALPLEAQRLGLESYASDLNPVAVLINKAMIEIPPKFAGRPPVNPEGRRELGTKTWTGAQGLAEDVRYYGRWMRDEAEKRIGHLYPKVEVTAEMARERPDLRQYVGKHLTVIAWLWARTVKSPNPAFADVEVPLASTFMLSTKPGKEAYAEPVIEGRGYRFTVRTGKPTDMEVAKNGTKLARANFRCLISGAPIAGDYIKAEGKAGRMGAQMMAIVAEGVRGRVYLSPTSDMVTIARQAKPEWKPDGDVPARLTGGTCVPYGLEKWGDLFTTRQLVALATFSDLVQEARERVKRDAQTVGLPSGDLALNDGGNGATAYADAIAVYLACGIDQLTRYLCTICPWNRTNENIAQAFGRQALPMVWDYAEANPIDSALGIAVTVGWTASAIERHVSLASGVAVQADAQNQLLSTDKIVSTDPPYYDNIGYADLSDFFYVWLRRSLRPIFPDLFATLAVPKVEELVATPYRHGSKEKAETFFLNGMTQAMHHLAEQSHPAFPVTIYYAFKQSESDGTEGKTNTGWDTFLEAIIRAGFAITGTWPIRTEKTEGLKGNENSLASSIVIVCRPLTASATMVSRRDFVTALRKELPDALRKMMQGNIAPVDLAQATIGPGMAIYSGYSKVLEPDGTRLPVRTALQIINEQLDALLTEEEGGMDQDTRFCLAWFQQFGMEEGAFGAADNMARAKGTAVDGLQSAGVLEASKGKVRLLKRWELPADWDPAKDSRRTLWKCTQHLVRALHAGGGGEMAAARLADAMGGIAEEAKALAYRLYTICERKGWAEEALSYNNLVVAWPSIRQQAAELTSETYVQAELKI